MMIRHGLAAAMLFASAVHAQNTCQGRPAVYGDIGVGMFQCVGANCMIAGRGSTDSVHVFSVEPTMWFIAEPARRQLQDGDALVAVDGLPITTRAAGARLALLRPGARTTLLVRRDTREFSVSLVAIASCERPAIQITNSAGSPAEVTRRVLSGFYPPDGTPQLERQLAALGIKASTVIDSIVPSSAAAGLGLRPGDVIVAIEQRSPTSPLVLFSGYIKYRRRGVLDEVFVTVNAPKR